MRRFRPSIHAVGRLVTPSYQQNITEEAFGAPGIEPRWTHGNKNGIGTAYSASSKIWFTLFGGIVTEVFYPTVDRPQIRDLQYLITDGKASSMKRSET